MLFIAGFVQEIELLKEFRGSVVIRDDRGLIIAAAALSFSGNLPVDIAEAKAVLEGFLMAEDLGIFSLCIECDALGVVGLCNEVGSIFLLDLLCQIAAIVFGV
ncbi:hypothetical protein Ddye_007160 [Dipteronia dyeriana]|uniref:RNase H type-1 domain-containing protein n=1 Tax=Dipteronia dyeriana TaxID=168575 RepID=A0AAE0CRD4_9ROSI|nr:hypothetical protein Ddye_007160 [Dipteronia dyeriana]